MATILPAGLLFARGLGDCRPARLGLASTRTRKLQTRLRFQCVAGEFDIGRLERYTERARSEVLFVRAVVDEEEDEVIIFKGFSSSLVRPTAADPSEPVLPPSAAIQSIDRIRGPYNPTKVKYIEQGISWEAFEGVLNDNGL